MRNIFWAVLITIITIGFLGPVMAATGKIVGTVTDTNSDDYLPGVKDDFNAQYGNFRSGMIDINTTSGNVQYYNNPGRW